jgi:hypothetical protein
VENTTTPQQSTSAAKPPMVNGHATSGEAKSATAQVQSLKARAAARGIGRKASTVVVNSKITARRPKQYEWVRVHPDADAYSIVLPVVIFGKEEADDEKAQATMQKPDVYAIHPDLMDHPTLAEDATKQVEYNLAITRNGKVFVWQHTYLDKENSWLDSEEENIAAARRTWIRQISGDGSYNRRESIKSFGEPQWPARDFESILIEALGDKFVADETHPLFKKLLGEE